MPKVIPPDKPLPFESYQEWKKRRLKAMGAKMTELEKNRIRGCIATLAMITAEKKENSRRHYDSQDNR